MTAVTGAAGASSVPVRLLQNPIPARPQHQLSFSSHQLSLSYILISEASTQLNANRQFTTTRSFHSQPEARAPVCIPIPKTEFLLRVPRLRWWPTSAGATAYIDHLPPSFPPVRPPRPWLPV